MKQQSDNLTIDMYENDAENYPPYDYEAFAKDCYLFNELTGQANSFATSDIKNQIALIQEELSETEDSIILDTIDEASLLDGCIDILVTAIGLAQKLENKGYDIATAMKRVADNNLSKFVATQEAAELTQQLYLDMGVATYIAKHKSGLYAIKRISDDKLMKPVGYESVDLSDLV